MGLGKCLSEGFESTPNQADAGGSGVGAVQDQEDVEGNTRVASPAALQIPGGSFCRF